MNPEDYELIEDESGKYPYPTWWVERINCSATGYGGTIVGGPFDSEEAAADWLDDELVKADRGP